MSGEERDFVALRFGLGPAAPDEDWSPDGMVKMVAGFGPGLRLALPSSAGRFVTRTQLLNERRQTKDAKADVRKQAQMRYAVFNNRTFVSDVHKRVIWAVTTPLPFVDRLLAYWSNHFTVSARQSPIGVITGPYEVEALQPHIGGRFADLLKAAVKHPAMLLYLNQSNSIGPNSPAGRRRNRGLNENLAREILELHTLGVNGGYTQADVTEFARLMTGWTVERKTGLAVFRRNQAEPGSKTLLGRKFGGGPAASGDFDAALDFLAEHPSTAKHVATRIVRHFIADDPAPDAIADVAQAFSRSGGDLLAVYRALASLPEARVRTGAKARTDRDFLIAALRAIALPKVRLDTSGDPPKGVGLTVGALRLLQQPYWNALSPAGWPEEAGEWLSPAGLAGRLQIIPRLVRTSTLRTPDELIDRALGSVVSERTSRIVQAASNRDEAMALVLASPEFNRR
ncbi:MAG: DUF1800 domain-containing protein [Alphaproteobacteria bacterium]|nr:DUF1800 domain-containing protein [Alphaproteobacteria bacterium]